MTSVNSRFLRKNGGEGRDSNPRVGLATAVKKLAAALANGDLSVVPSIGFDTMRCRSQDIRTNARLNKTDPGDSADDKIVNRRQATRLRLLQLSEDFVHDS